VRYEVLWVEFQFSQSHRLLFPIGNVLENGECEFHKSESNRNIEVSAGSLKN
jgi:hypothetical protein